MNMHSNVLYEDVAGISASSNRYLAECHVADWAVGAYFAAAFSPSNHVASSQGTVYKSLRKAAIAAIRQAYGMTELMAGRVLDVMSDHGTYVERSGVSDAVQFVRDHRTSPAYSR